MNLSVYMPSIAGEKRAVEGLCAMCIYALGDIPVTKRLSGEKDLRVFSPKACQTYMFGGVP